MLRTSLILLGLAWALALSAQTASQKEAVQLSATIQAAPPSITLNWVSFSSATGYTIYRKTRSEAAWTSIGTASASTTQLADNGVTVGTYYEYKIVRTQSSGTGTGYIASGINVAPTEYRGKMVLLVDNTFSFSVASQLTTLEADLRADGWGVIRHDVSRATSAVNVRALIQGDYNADPSNVKAVFVIGHVAVPHSGNLNPDGHGDHQGAWPADGYYGELNGTWTDNSVNNSSSQNSRNHNTPGDGDFDQSDFPSTLELQVGRIDFYEFESFQYYQGLSETQLTINYLNKLHQFKTKAFTPTFRGAVFDNFDDMANGLASAGYRSISALVGPSNLSDLNPNGAPFTTYINDQSYLWTFACGGGSFSTCSNVGSTGEYASTVSMGGVFNMCIGSYFGDWDSYNNFMKAPLGSGKALTNVWSGIPNWFFHHMGMGDNIGYSALVSMNNTTLYTPQSSGWQGSPYNRVHMGLMGDPSLRQVMVSMPSNIQVTNSGGLASFTWTATSGVDGYYVYDLGNGTGVPQRVTPNVVTGTSFSSPAVPFVSGRQYMVRSVKLEVTPTGSFTNLSLGAFGTASGQATTNVVVAPRMVLEGPYDSGTGLMTDGLRMAGFIPLAEPYTALGYAQAAGGGGESTTQAVLNVTGNNAIVDWVRVELRSSGTPATVLATRQALLQRDGDVVGTDGTTALSFGVGTGSYYVVVRHRNHLGAMTANALSLSATSTTVDLKATTLSTYGSGALKTIGTVRALWAGNVVPDNELLYTGTG